LVVYSVRFGWKEAASSVMDLPHAWAVLGLRPGSSLDQVRTRYLFLAKQWHPDRHGGVRQDEEEAARQMQLINSAYRQILEAKTETRPEPASAPKPGRAPTGRRLTREEIDHFVASMGTESWVDGVVGPSSYDDALTWLLQKAPGNQWALSASTKTALVFLAGCILICVVYWRSGDAGRSPLWFAVFGATGLASWYWMREGRS
jgi:hypothetical protein